MKSGYSKALTIILIIIIVAVVGLLAYLGYDYYSRYRTNKDSEAYVDTLTDGVIVDTPTVDTPIVDGTSSTDNTNSTDANSTTTETVTSETSESGTSAKKNRPKYKGFYTLGSIEIPKTKVKYPILERVTKRSLELSVAVVWPENAELNQPGNVVIVGHNYRNGLFFSDNKKLSKGDKIYITDLDKKKITYTIYKIFETTDNDTSFYNRDTKGKREITLSTCTDNSAARLIIQARE